MIPFSILDLCPILEGNNIAQSFKNSVALAQLAEQLEFNRFWLAEHHNMSGIASAATSLIISHVAAATQHIRVGSGGIMLPNHVPLIIAEQFGTLATLYPNRIDLGIGRARGTDLITASALRRNLDIETENFPEDVVELRHYLQPKQPHQKLVAIPGENTKVPLWLLGSSLFSAGLAATLSLPFAFASHFAPALLKHALTLYKEQFQPSEDLSKPYTMAAIVVIVADTDEEANYLFSSMQLQSILLRRGQSKPLPLPCKNIREHCTAAEFASIQQSFAEAIVGSPSTVAEKLRYFIELTEIDELMVVARIFDQQAAHYSLTKLAEVRDNL